MDTFGTLGHLGDVFGLQNHPLNPNGPRYPPELQNKPSGYPNSSKNVPKTTKHIPKVIRNYTNIVNIFRH